MSLYICTLLYVQTTKERINILHLELTQSIYYDTLKLEEAMYKRWRKEEIWKKLNLYEFCKLVVFLISIFKIPLGKIKNWSLNFNEFTKLPFCNDF